MERHGECNDCGWCCQFEGIHRNVVYPIEGEGTVPPSDRRFYELRGGRPVDGGRVVLYVMQAYLPCSMHDQPNSRCMDYDARPEICREFPSTPEQIEGTPCSYWFEDGGVRRGGGGSPHPTPPTFRIG